MKQSHCWTNAAWRCCWYVYCVCLEQDWISHMEAADAADVLLIAAGSGYVITGLSWQLNGSHSDTQRWDTECKKWNEGLDFKIKPKCLWSYHGKRVLFGCSRWDQNPVSESRMLQEIRPFIFACPFKLESVIIIVCQGGPVSRSRSSSDSARQGIISIPGRIISDIATCLHFQLLSTFDAIYWMLKSWRWDLSCCVVL